MGMTKTPDEIKKGMAYCVELCCPLEKCPYYDAESCATEKTYDAIAYMQQLEAERDALLKYITDSTWAACDICKHGIDGASVLDCKHIREVGVPCFEWRGVQKEE